MARLALLVAISLAAASSAAAQTGSSAKLLTDGRAAYYSLSRQGFAGGACKMAPDWPTSLGKPRNDPSVAGAFQILDSLRFTLKVDKAGTATVDKVDPGAPRQGQVAEGISQIFTGVDQTFAGFFQTWSLFMLHSPLPAPQDPVTLTAQGGGYHLAYKDAGTDVATDMGRNLEISKIDVRSAQFRSVILPRFQRTPQGLVLASYVGDYTPTSGRGATHIDVTVDYQDVSGLQLPRTISVDATVDGERSKARFVLSECRVTKGS